MSAVYMKRGEKRRRSPDEDTGKKTRERRLTNY
jgi:hypothetical protein